MRITGQSRSIPTLDGWRAVAALLVIVSHEFREHGSPLGVPLGAAGVKIFFALSGYLICNLASPRRAGKLPDFASQVLHPPGIPHSAAGLHVFGLSLDRDLAGVALDRSPFRVEMRLPDGEQFNARLAGEPFLDAFA
jgi:hypothetical protein